MLSFLARRLGLLIPTFLVWTSFATAILSITGSRYTTYGAALAALLLSAYFQFRDKMNWVGNWDLWQAVRWTEGPRGQHLELGIAEKTVKTHAKRLLLKHGADPNTRWLDGCVAMDAKGFIKTGPELSAVDLTAANWPLARPPYLLETSLPGVIISLVSISFMWALVYAKRRVGRALGSEPILADAECSLVCIYMSLVLLASSLIYQFTGFGLADSIGALGLIYFSLSEGREAFHKARGETD